MKNSPILRCPKSDLCNIQIFDLFHDKFDLPTLFFVFSYCSQHPVKSVSLSDGGIAGYVALTKKWDESEDTQVKREYKCKQGMGRRILINGKVKNEKEGMMRNGVRWESFSLCLFVDVDRFIKKKMMG